MTIAHPVRPLRARLSGIAQALAVALVAAPLIAAPTPAAAQEATAGDRVTTLSVGRGTLVNLPGTAKDVYVADPKVADVQVRSARQIYVYGKGPGETSIQVNDAQGRSLFTTIARVGNNLDTIDQMLSVAMPDANIVASTMNGMVLLTGTVASPDEAEDAERLVTAFVGEKTKVVSRLQTATPLQVNLQVRIAEVNRSLVKEISGNLLTRDMGSGILGGIFRGRDTGTITTEPSVIDPNTQQVILPARTQYRVNRAPDINSLYLGGRLFGLDVLGTLDAGEKSGLVATLAQPNLTALSGETAEFLAGGEFPIPVPSTLGGTSIEYRKYGVSLAYTPVVLASGRISMRVRPEVSELTQEGAIRLSNIQIPGLVIRRAETTVELGSGESFMIAGLLNNRSAGQLNKIPALGDIPILGTMFKSDDYRRGETELVIVVTPYLVRPVSANQIKLPTDAFETSNDAQRLFLNQQNGGVTGGDRPKPTRGTAPGGGAPAAAPGFSDQ